MANQDAPFLELLKNFDSVITKVLCGLFLLTKTARKSILLNVLYFEQAFYCSVTARFLVVFNSPTPEEISLL